MRPQPLATPLVATACLCLSTACPSDSPTTPTTATKPDPSQVVADDETPTTPPTKPTTKPTTPVVQDSFAGTPAPSPWNADAQTTATLGDGRRVVVAAARQGSKSLLWAQAVDAEGAPSGPAVKLRTTSGHVEAIAADSSASTLWVAWRSQMQGPPGNALVASAQFDASARALSKPKLLVSAANDTDIEEQTGIKLVAHQSGGATLAALLGTHPCPGSVPGEGPTQCAALRVFVLDNNGDATRSERRLLDGGDAALDDLVDLGAAAATSFHAWRGGPLTDVAVIPNDAATPVRKLDTCGYPPIDLARQETSLVALCPDPDEGAPTMLSVQCTATSPKTCGHLTHVDATGRALSPSTADQPGVAVQAIALQCDGDATSVRLAWGSGPDDAVVLAPEALMFAATARCPG